MNSNGQLRITDSTTVSNVALRRILTAAEQKKVLDEQVILLNQRIAGFELVIKEYKEKDTATVGSYERQISTMKEQRKIFEDQIKQNEKIIRKLKRKVFWTSAAGIAGMGTMAFLLLTK
jgi:hypothetical protein